MVASNRWMFRSRPHKEHPNVIMLFVITDFTHEKGTHEQVYCTLADMKDYSDTESLAERLRTMLSETQRINNRILAGKSDEYTLSTTYSGKMDFTKGTE